MGCYRARYDDIRLLLCSSCILTHSRRQSYFQSIFVSQFPAYMEWLGKHLEDRQKRLVSAEIGQAKDRKKAIDDMAELGMGERERH